MCCAVTTNESHRKKTHSTIHAFPSVRNGRAPRHRRAHSEGSTPQVAFSAFRGPKGAGSRAKGALWGDANTAPIPKLRNKKVKKKSVGPENEFKITETEDIALRNELKRALMSVKQRHIKAVLPTLRTLDAAKDGRLSFEKVKQTLQKNQISLSETGFRNLSRKFGERVESHHCVHYASLVSYVSQLWAEAAALPKKKPTTPPAAGFSNNVGRIGGYVTKPSYVGVDHTLFKMRNRDVYGNGDVGDFMSSLQMELRECSSVKMADLRAVMYGFDGDRSGVLSEGQVYASFQRCGIPVSPDVFHRFLLASDRTGMGAYDIETMIDYVAQARPDLQQYFILGAPHEAEVPPLSGQPSSSNYYAEEEEEEESFADPFSEMSSLFDPDEENDEGAFDPVRWSHDFRFLVEALHQADEGRVGFMSEQDALRTASTYNLVYSLSLSTSTLNASLRASLDRHLNQINVDHFVSLLERNHFEERR